MPLAFVGTSSNVACTDALGSVINVSGLSVMFIVHCMGDGSLARLS